VSPETSGRSHDLVPDRVPEYSMRSIGAADAIAPSGISSCSPVSHGLQCTAAHSGSRQSLRSIEIWLSEPRQGALGRTERRPFGLDHLAFFRINIMISHRTSSFTGHSFRRCENASARARKSAVNRTVFNSHLAFARGSSPGNRSREAVASSVLHYLSAQFCLRRLKWKMAGGSSPNI
jgi:hypothetical protein